MCPERENIFQAVACLESETGGFAVAGHGVFLMCLCGQDDMIPKEKMLDAKTATPDGGERKHITEDAMHSALEAFIGRPSPDERGNVVWDGGNEYWRDLFMEAPTGARLRLSLNFYFSENHEKPDFPMLEYRAIRKAIEDAMDFDSLEYLIANESNVAAKNHYIDIWKARMDVKEGKVKV